MTIEKIWNDLPKIVRTMIVILVIILTIIIVVGVTRLIKKTIARQDVKQTLNESNQELKEVLKIQKPTNPDSVYSSMSTQIVSMLSGCDGYKNDPNVYLLMLKIRNDADWLKLVDAFGIRKIEGCGFTSDYEADVATVIKKEASELTILGINKWFSTINPKTGNTNVSYRI